MTRFCRDIFCRHGGHVILDLLRLYCRYLCLNMSLIGGGGWGPLASLVYPHLFLRVFFALGSSILTSYLFFFFPPPALLSPYLLPSSLSPTTLPHPAAPFPFLSPSLPPRCGLLFQLLDLDLVLLLVFIRFCCHKQRRLWTPYVVFYPSCSAVLCFAIGFSSPQGASSCLANSCTATQVSNSNFAATGSITGVTGDVSN